MRFDYSSAEAQTGSRHPRRWLLLAALVLVSAGALISREGSAYRHPFVNAPSVQAEAGDSVRNLEGDGLDELLPVADPEPAVPAASVSETAETDTASVEEWTTLTVGRGQAFSTLIESVGLPREDWVSITQMGSYGKRLRLLRVGETIKIRVAEGRLQELLYELGETQTLHIARNGGDFEGYIIAKPLERRPAHARGTIQSSLFAAGREAGLSSGLVMELAEIFGYDIDFAMDIREGDRFSVIYEEIYKDGKKLRDGPILAAEFVNQGQPVRAVRYTDPAGNTSYYAPDGQSLRKAFRRMPLDIGRVSSHFNLRRRHPILNKIRAHKGTDYAAPYGTPIRATGDGRVAFMGSKGGYGRTVILKHGVSYETLYAHMSRYRPGLSVGSRVKQGQIIGYVGASGLATAAHLHYEFRINGIQKNPLTVALPRGNPLPKHLVAQFKEATTPLLAQLETLSTQVASAN